MRVLVCGGRAYANRDLLDATLDALLPVECLIEGGAGGADRMAHEWAKKRGVIPHTFAADWNRYGQFAGPLRNGVMLKEGKPDLVVAFPGGRGTANMIKQANDAGVRVKVIT